MQLVLLIEDLRCRPSNCALLCPEQLRAATERDRAPLKAGQQPQGWPLAFASPDLIQASLARCGVRQLSLRSSPTEPAHQAGANPPALLSLHPALTCFAITVPLDRGRTLVRKGRQRRWLC